MKRKVLISGASIAGPALAYWLIRYGFEVTIVERAAAIRPGGFAVDFRGASLRVLEHMGLLEAARRKQTRVGAITIVDSEHRRIASMPDGFTCGELEILRGDLGELLFESTKDTAEYLFDDSISEIRDEQNDVHVRFKSGHDRRFDLVVGADGLHSKVRSLVFGEEANVTQYMGYYISAFTVPNYLGLDRKGLFYNTPGKKIGIFNNGNPAEAGAAFFFATHPLDYERRDVKRQKALLRNHFAGEAWEATKLLELMESASDFYFDSISQVKMKHWFRGRTVLLGDAAYCASPLSGMGTGLAIVGAYVLAGELAAAEGSAGVAFANYEEAMREFVQKCQGLANGAGDWFIPRTRFRLWLSTLMYKSLPYTPWKNLMIELPTKIGNSIVLKDYTRSS